MGSAPAISRSRHRPLSARPPASSRPWGCAHGEVDVELADSRGDIAGALGDDGCRLVVVGLVQETAARIEVPHMSPEKIPPTSRSPGTNASGYTCSGIPCRQPMASSVLRKYGTSGTVAPGQTYPEALANRLNVAPPGWPITSASKRPMLFSASLWSRHCRPGRVDSVYPAPIPRSRGCSRYSRSWRRLRQARSGGP